MDRASAEGRTWGQASGAVTGEGGGCQGLPGERRNGQWCCQDLRGESADGTRRQESLSRYQILFLNVFIQYEIRLV